MSNEQPYYYWRDSYTYQGNTLVDCYQKFGTGIKMISVDVCIEFIFLTAKRTDKHIWILRLSEIYFGRNVPCARYEKNKKIGCFPQHPYNHIVIHTHKYIMGPYYNEKQTKIIRKLKQKGVTRNDLIT